MKKIVTPQEMQEIDRKTIQAYGIPGETLMENAGRSVFEFLIRTVPDLPRKKTVIFCGKGNNGGDGFVIARMMIQSGIKPMIYMLGQIPDLKHDALLNFNKLITTGVPVQFLNQTSQDLSVTVPEVVIDAILGTGSKGDLDGLIYDVVQQINRWKQDHGTNVVAVDIPSGLNGETGLPGNTAVMADTTVTFGLPKQGLLFGEGKKFSGKLITADIGFPDALVSGGDRLLIENEDVRRLFKPRHPGAYKYQFGKVLVIAGSRGMTGSSFLAAKAALRSGAGMLKVAAPECVIRVIENRLPEALTSVLPETSPGSVSMKALDQLKALVSWSDSVAIGPGLSRHEETMGLICELMSGIDRPVVVDADAVIALSHCADSLRLNETPMVFTPHDGEFAALAGLDTAGIRENRIFHLVQTVRKLRKTILLKGSPTCIAGPNTPVMVTNTGNPGMATAGSGDVLTGMIAAFLAQGMTCEQAACAGAWIHGLAGDLAAAEITQIGMIAGDLIDYLPAAFKIILQSQD